MKDHIAVLIPCYNESRTIEKVVRDFKRMLPEATVYVYDNNSSDGTGEIAGCGPAPWFAGEDAGQGQRHSPHVSAKLTRTAI